MKRVLSMGIWMALAFAMLGSGVVLPSDVEAMRGMVDGRFPMPVMKSIASAFPG